LFPRPISICNSMRLKQCLLFLAVAFFTIHPLAAEDVSYRSTDGKLHYRSNEPLVKTVNPHAVLSLQTEDDCIILVTARERSLTVQQLFDGLPSSFTDGTHCEGRVMLSVDGSDAPSFMVTGLFPPEGEPTHDTLYAVANRGDREYTFMIHYPVDLGDAGFEWAVESLSRFGWEESAGSTGVEEKI